MPFYQLLRKCLFQGKIDRILHHLKEFPNDQQARQRIAQLEALVTQP